MAGTMNGSTEGEKPHMVIGIDLGMTVSTIDETVFWD